MTPVELAHIHAQCFKVPRPWSAKEFETLLQSKFVTLICAPECFALVRIVADEAELLTIATAPLHQRQGHASKIMDAVIHHCATCEAKTIFLEVAENNIAAKALYTAKGFAKTGHRAGYYRLNGQKNIDAEIFTKK